MTADSKSTKAVSLRNVSKRFGETVVLSDINFDVADGEIAVLLGASGSGKTTILRIIAGLETPDDGTVALHGRDVTALPARLRGTGVIFQAYALFPMMNVEENIGYGLRIRKKTKKEIKETVGRLVEMVDLAAHRKKRPSQLSGGQQQRVAIARALAYEPEVLLFDEPFGALDAKIRVSLRQEIRTLLKRINVPSVFITHDQEEALELGDRIAVLNAGRLEQMGTPFEVYTNPATEHVATFLGSANIIEGEVRDGQFVHEGITLDTDAADVSGKAKLVIRPEDVFLRRPANLSRDYQMLCSGTVDEVAFAGAFERVIVKLHLPDKPLIVVVRPKTETAAFPLRAGDEVPVGVVRSQILPPDAERNRERTETKI